MVRLTRLVPVVAALALVLPAAPSPAVSAPAAEPTVVGDPRGDARAFEGSGRQAKRAADLLLARYHVVDRTLRVTWEVVDMTKRRTPILEVEGKAGRRRFTVDVSRPTPRPPVPQLWVGADERSCRGLGGFMDRRRDVGGFWLPLRCLPRGQFARVRSFSILETDEFASDQTRATRIRIR